MKKALFAGVAAVAVVAMGGVSWAQVGGNAIPKYSTVTSASKNRKVTASGVGGNSMPSYPKAEHLTKNMKVTPHGVGGNFVPHYAKTGSH
jgi:hypothetical protein